MRDLPVFTTEHGVASVTLSDIPYRKKAFFRLQSCDDVAAMIGDCVQFCKAAGAEQIFGAGDGLEGRYPLQNVLYQMASLHDSLPDTDACLFPLQEKTMSKWRDIYNDKMKRVSGAAWMTEKMCSDLLAAGTAYFIHEKGQLLGIGCVTENTVSVVASLKAAAGREIVCALNHVITEETVYVEVASDNQKAIALYESLGFLRQKELTRWYKVL